MSTQHVLRINLIHSLGSSWIGWEEGWWILSLSAFLHVARLPAGKRPPAALLQSLQHYWSADQRGQRPGTGRWHENQGPLRSWVRPISSQHGDSWPMRGLGETSVRLCQAVLSVWARDIFAIVGVSESGLQHSLYCSTAVHYRLQYTAPVWGKDQPPVQQRWLSPQCHLLPIWWQWPRGEKQD